LKDTVMLSHLSCIDIICRIPQSLMKHHGAGNPAKLLKEVMIPV
jgi:hypothetical protein